MKGSWKVIGPDRCTRFREIPGRGEGSEAKLATGVSGSMTVGKRRKGRGRRAGDGSASESLHGRMLLMVVAELSEGRKLGREDGGELHTTLE